MTAVFERFTERAIRSVMLAQKEAKALGRKEVATEQILLGLVGEERSSDGFLGTGVSMERARDAVRSLVEDGTLAASVRTDKPVAEVPFSFGSKRVFEAALEESRKLGHNFIAPEHLVVAILSVELDGAGKLLERLRLRPEKLKSEALARLRGELDRDGRSTASLSGATLSASPSRGARTSASPSFSRSGSKREKSALSDFCVDLTARAVEGRVDPVIGREREVERVVQILARRTKNNPILLGEPGVGKTAIAEGLALRIAENDVPAFLFGKRVMSLDLGLLLAGSKDRGELETRVTGLIAEVIKVGDVILMIDEVHSLVGTGSVSRGGAEGAGLNISNLLKPPLARGLLQCIGATTLDEHRKHIEKDKALARRFQPVMVLEPSESDAVRILLGLRSRYERHHHCHITQEAVEAAVQLSSRYIADRFLPDKAIDLMDEAGSRARIDAFHRRKFRRSAILHKSPAEYWGEINAAYAFHDAELVKNSVGGGGLSAFFSGGGDSPAGGSDAVLTRGGETQFLPEIDIVDEEDMDDGPVVVGVAEIAAVASMWSGVPLAQLTADEQKQLQDLDAVLKERVIGQDDAVGAISRAVRRARVGLKDPDRPIAAMLFCGPTGVGKTELAKALSHHYFGSEGAMIRLDMSEYMERHTVSKLVGSPPGYVGYGEGGKLTEAVRKQPFSLILLDEIEKAHPDVFNLLLQIFEDGRLTDSQGRVVSFKNTLVVMTSNVASSVIARGGSSRIGFTLPDPKAADGGKYAALKELVMEELKGFFRPELLNRLDEVVVFRSLEQAQVNTIMEIMLKETITRVQERGIHLEITEAVRGKICSEGFDRAYGARPLRRALTRLVEDPVSESILLGGFEDGDTALVDVDEEGLTVVTRIPWPNPCEHGTCLEVLHTVDQVVA